MGIRILLIEDDDDIADFLVRGLREEGFTVARVADGGDGRHRLLTESWDVVLLDWWLPVVDGLTLLREIRAAKNETPVLLLTARDAVSERVSGLDSGADDYLCKPFAFEELLARIRALTRRQDRRSSTLLSYHDVSVDLSTQRVSRGGARIELTVKEQALLVFFLRHPGRSADAHPNLRASLGRALRRAVEHAGSACQRIAPQARSTWATVDFYRARAGIRAWTLGAWSNSNAVDRTI